MSAEDLGSKGEFRLLSKIGEGGMADVFLAERMGDDGFRTRVALKRLHQGLAMDSYFIRQLVREARLLGQLEHANIVRVFDLRRIGDEYFVVMEYVDGIDLAAAIKVHRQRKTKIPLPFFFHVALSLLEALSYAHAAVDIDGNATPLIHRDIKPSNVMLSRRGVVKLTDFGIAHVGDGSVTGGMVQGTANYMSPEQAYGEEHLTAASDIYSLGVVFFEMLCGRPLVTGDNYLKAIQQVRDQQVSSEDLERLGVKPGLRMVVARMLSNEKEKRYTDPDMVRNDLQFVADRLGVNLSWHRIRSYVGRLMGILGRAPTRATLSNLEVQHESTSQGFSSGAYGAESTLPPVASDDSAKPVTPPPVQSGQSSTADVTSAVRKDLLDLQLSSPGLSEQATQPVGAINDEDDSQKTAVSTKARQGIPAVEEAELEEAELEEAELEEAEVEEAELEEAELEEAELEEAEVEEAELEEAELEEAELETSSATGATATVSDWIEDDETAVYTGQLPGEEPQTAASATEEFGSFDEDTDEKTIPYVAGAMPGQKEEGVSAADQGKPSSSTHSLEVPSRQSGSFPPPPLSLTGEFRPNRQPPKPTPAVAFLPEATEAGPTGTQVLDTDTEPEDKTWVLGGAAPGVQAAAQAPQPRAPATAAQAPARQPKRKKKRRRKKKKPGSKLFGLDNRTVLLAAIFSVVIGTLLFIILVVLLMRTQSPEKAGSYDADPLEHSLCRATRASGLELAWDSGILPPERTVPVSCVSPLAAYSRSSKEESTT
jgi:eukaryotic-like serine/threonine-protein kinase